jgi:hypothetical protein
MKYILYKCDKYLLVFHGWKIVPVVSVDAVHVENSIVVQTICQKSYILLLLVLYISKI